MSGTFCLSFLHGGLNAMLTDRHAFDQDKPLTSRVPVRCSCSSLSACQMLRPTNVTITINRMTATVIAPMIPSRLLPGCFGFLPRRGAMVLPLGPVSLIFETKVGLPGKPNSIKGFRFALITNGFHVFV
ncbi:hypothetical protein QUC32_03200 [Novosphingobium resinovorum]|uniref:hypothetical protein n=1 Tax=Novosphingobium resinovorum TaxID=158500 RepID=UPI0025A09A63|nr:hypothetical protein [Novosphingobium resinovorum]MBF7013836.1 hypothetical protein [Novosphingobium sp. HR1a]WJM25980.1 hypothetical protein QUC32_03200 [Novosphingobium resinovorum]